MTHSLPYFYARRLDILFGLCLLCVLALFYISFAPPTWVFVTRPYSAIVLACSFTLDFLRVFGACGISLLPSVSLPVHSTPYSKNPGWQAMDFETVRLCSWIILVTRGVSVRIPYPLLPLGSPHYELRLLIYISQPKNLALVRGAEANSCAIIIIK